MKLQQLAKLISDSWNVIPFTDDEKKMTDDFLLGSHYNPMQKKVEFNSCFFTEHECTIPAERWIK